MAGSRTQGFSYEAVWGKDAVASCWPPGQLLHNHTCFGNGASGLAVSSLCVRSLPGTGVTQMIPAQAFIHHQTILCHMCDNAFKELAAQRRELNQPVQHEKRGWVSPRKFFPGIIFKQYFLIWGGWEVRGEISNYFEMLIKATCLLPNAVDTYFHL